MGAIANAANRAAYYGYRRPGPIKSDRRSGGPRQCGVSCTGTYLEGYHLFSPPFGNSLRKAGPQGMEADANHSKKRRGPFSRADHRSRSHDSAHADPSLAEPPDEVLDHPLVPRGSGQLITDDKALGDLIAHLREVGTFAYDSEFIGELTYFPKLCLIQVASRERVALVDPLARLELKPFWELLADPSVEKVVHAGQQDIEPVIRHLGQAPANIFDTQVTAGFVGLPYPVSLSKLVNELTGARLGKGLTFSHWDQRPLSAMQLRYAADDVRYLPLVREELRKRLEALGHARWASEECAALCDTSLFRFDPETQYLRVRGATSFQPRNLAVLRELTAWRDAAARADDVPPRTLLRDEVLLDLARNPVKSVEKLNRVRGLPRPVEQAHGRRIIELTARALSLPAASLPPAREVEPSPSERFRADSLWAATQCLCAGRSIDPALVSSRQEIGDFYRHIQAGNADPSQRLLTGWRREAVGDPLMRMIRGEIAVDLGWKQGTLRALIKSTAL